MRHLKNFITEKSQKYIVIYNGTENFPHDEDIECNTQEEIDKFQSAKWEEYNEETAENDLETPEVEDFEDFCNRCFVIQTL